MDIHQTQAAEQQLILTQEMRQSLHILQLALPDLRQYLLDEALSNPLLEVEDPQPALQPAVAEREPSFGQPGQAAADGPELFRQMEDRSGNDLTGLLHEQLLRMPYLDRRLAGLCGYLVECLDEHGYLSFPVDELAQVLNCPVFEVEQALYVVQSLEPAGVGARSLSECLILQLAQSPNLNEHTIRLATQGLDLLAKNDLNAMAQLLGCTREQAQQAAQTVRQLNPRPVRGLEHGGAILYQVPEAEVFAEDGRLKIEMNRTFLPCLRLDPQVCGLLQDSAAPEERSYLRKCAAQAEKWLRGGAGRETTLEKLLRVIVHRQARWFLEDAPLQPLTMREIAEELALSPSTVSRAIQQKTLVFRGQSLPLKQFICGRVEATGGQAVSTGEVKQHLQRLIQAEDAARPLSDEALQMALGAAGFPVSRRTVAKYREELAIPRASARRKR